MKKFFFPFACIALIALICSACQGKKDKEPVMIEDIKAEVQITRELKDELIKTFEQYQQYEAGFFKMMQEGRDEKLVQTDNIYLPLSYAEKAQTLDQKYFLMGMYMNDILGERYFNRINDEERAKIVAKLAVETNMPALASTNWEQVMKVTWDELQSEKAANLLADFKTALDNGSADKFIQIATGAYIEAKYSQNVVREMIGELANSQPPAWVVHANVEKCIVELVDKMLPFYPTLKATLPLVSDMRDLHREMTDEEMKVAYSHYIDNIKERRAAFLAELQ